MPTPTKLKAAEHLMVLPVPLRLADDGRGGWVMMFEQQACNGLARWCDSFDTLLVAAPVLPEPLVAGRKAMAWLPVDQIPTASRVEFVPLPWGKTVRAHLRSATSVRRQLRGLIDRSTYLHFGVGGLWGDWAGLACEEAYSMRRPYAAHADRVEDQLVLRTAQSKSLLRRVRARLIATQMKRWHRALIERASLMLCHGNDTFNAYRPLNAHAHLIHNIHADAADQATAEQAAAKARRTKEPRPIRIAYAGRADREKAPLDWVRAIGHAVQQGAQLSAVWLGDGGQMQEARDEARRLALESIIEFPGFTSDRATVLDTIRSADLFVFTHVTPESPRCLIEALITATPIVGYGSHYPADLIAGHGGGRLVPTGDWQRLGDEILALSRDRDAVAKLIMAAQCDGARFTSEGVFRERSELIKRYLTPNKPPAGSFAPVQLLST